MTMNIHRNIDAAVAQLALDIFWMLTPYWGKFNIQK